MLSQSAIRRALDGTHLYIGDGATMTRSIIRCHNGWRIGHASIRTQLDWCAAHRVRYVIFTHCGSQIVDGGGRSLGALGRERGVAAWIAHDRMNLRLDQMLPIRLDSIDGHARDQSGF
jgi:hypothetical protein